MALPAYATAEQLTEWLPDDVPTPSDAARRLTRASELIDEKVTGAYELAADGLPADPAVRQVLADAACAQVEQWAEIGEEVDVAGFPAGTSMTVGPVTVSRQPAELAPRARRILCAGGLLTPDTR